MFQLDDVHRAVKLVGDLGGELDRFDNGSPFQSEIDIGVGAEPARSQDRAIDPDRLGGDKPVKLYSQCFQGAQRCSCWRMWSEKATDNSTRGGGLAQEGCGDGRVRRGCCPGRAEGFSAG